MPNSRMYPMAEPSKLTQAIDQLAHVVAEMISNDVDPQLAHKLHGAIAAYSEQLIEAATIMAASSVLTVDRRVTAQLDDHARTHLDVKKQISDVLVRLSEVEDHVSQTGILGGVVRDNYMLATKLETLEGLIHQLLGPRDTHVNA